VCFKRNWPVLLAVALQAESLWKLLKWALDWRGRYDSLAATYHEIGGASAVIGYILDPPPLFYPLAFFVGLILIWWNFRRNRRNVHIHHVEIREHMGIGASVSPVVVQWKDVPEAIGAFAESSLLKARDKWKAQFEEACEKGHEVEEQIRNIRTKFTGGHVPDDTPEAGHLATAQRKLEIFANSHDLAKDELRRAWEGLLSDIHKKLTSGKLIAKGFRAPHVAGSPEIEIPPSEWRILLIDIAKSDAFRGGETVYAGLMISKCPPA